MLSITPQVVSITGTANQVIVSSPNGSVALSLPQNIHTAATPTFAGMTINGDITVTSSTTSGVINHTITGLTLMKANATGLAALAIRPSDDTTATQEVFAVQNAAGSATRFRVLKGGNVESYGDFYISGNLGMGSAPTEAVLDIRKASTYNSESTAGLSILSAASDSKLIMGADATNDITYIQSMQQGTSYTNRPLAINPNGGNVGIGTTTPGSLFHILKAQDATTKGFVENSNTGSSAAAAFQTHADTAYGTFATLSSNYSFNNYKANMTYLQGDGSNGLMLDAPNAAGYILFQTGGQNTTNERMRITSGGNVGIGTTTPGQKLHLSGSGDVALQISTTGTTGYTYLNFGDSGANGSGQIRYYHTSDLMDFTVNNSTAMTILSSGNVGIGTIAPGSLLELSKATATAVRVTHTTTSSYSQLQFNESSTEQVQINVIGTTFATTARRGFLELIQEGATGGVSIWTNTTQRLTVINGGNVGIGLTPSSTLGRLAIYGVDNSGAKTFTGYNADAGLVLDAYLDTNSPFLRYSDIIATGSSNASNGGATMRFATQPRTTGDPVVRLTLDYLGNVVIGTAALATNATDGFLYIPTSAGAPTGTPTTQTGRVAIEYDTTNNKLSVYNGAWKSVTLA